MPVKIALLKPGASQLLSQLVQVGLVVATWPALPAMEPGLKIIDFSAQASFATPLPSSVFFCFFCKKCCEAVAKLQCPSRDCPQTGSSVFGRFSGSFTS